MKTFNHKSGKLLSLNGAQIYYEVIGNQEGTPLLFLHGGFGDLEDFNEITSDLSEKYRIIGVDSRGHGKSTIGSQKLTYELLQNDVEAVLKDLGISSLSIIGFSDGGVVGYRLASLCPQLKINQLVTIGSSWHTKNEQHMRGFFSTLTGDRWKAKFPAHYESYQKLNPEPNFDHLTSQIVNMWLDESESGFPNDRAKSISSPTLLVRGENDPLILEDALKELAKSLSNAQIASIPSAGHEAHKEQKALFIKKIEDFLSM